MPPDDRRWEFAVRSPGESRVTRTTTGPLELWVLGIPPGRGPAEAASWLRDVAEVAIEGAAQASGALPIPRVLYHAVSGLLFSHADTWGPGRSPCSIVFSSEGDDVGVGWVGPAAVEVWIDGRRESVRLVTVRDAHGRDGFAWSISRDREVRLVLRWPASMDEPQPFEIELESRWEGREAPTMAWFARPSATAGWVSAEPAAAAEAPEPGRAPSFEAAESAPASDAARAEADSGWEVYEPAVAGEALPESVADADDAADRESIARLSDAAEADASSRADARAVQLEPADETGHAEAHAALHAERPSSGIARWLQRNFGWFGRHADAAPPAATAGDGLAPEPATDEAAVATLAPPDAAGAFAGGPPDAENTGSGEAHVVEPGAADSSDAAAGLDDEDVEAIAAPAAASRRAASREDELAASAAALAAMLVQSRDARADEVSPQAPALADDFAPAWHRTVEESNELIPPTPEPRDLTERTAPVGNLAAPPRAHAIEAPGAPPRLAVPAPAPGDATGLEITSARDDATWEVARESRPPALSIEAPSGVIAGEPLRPLGSSLDDMQALSPPAPLAAPLATPEPPADAPGDAPNAAPEAPEEAPAVKLPSWLRMPGDTPATQVPRDPREIALEPVPVASLEATAVAPPTPWAEELPRASADHAVEPAPAWAESPAVPETPRRRVPALHPEWPSDVRLEKPKPSRTPWIWTGAVLAVLFGAGWLVGMLQEAPAPGQRPRGPLGPLLGALGVRGASFSLEVKSQPEGAWVLVDGKPTEQRTPVTIPLAPGAHRVSLSFGQWGENTFQVEGARGETVPLDAQMWGSLELIAPEPGSVVAVSIDGKPRGFAPLRVDSLAPGPHQVRYSGPGIVSWGQTVEIGVGEEKQLLTRAITSPATGLLMVRAQTNDEDGTQDLVGARVWIDGQPRGSTPLTLELPRGPHSIRVQWQSETPPVQVIDLPGGNQRFATFPFGSGDEYPQVRVTPPPRIAADGSTVINVTVDGLPPGEVRETWLHVEGEDHGWRRYPMTRLADAFAAVGAASFPIGAFGAGDETRWYVSAATQHGDEYFTEIATVRLEGRPPR